MGSRGAWFEQALHCSVWVDFDAVFSFFITSDQSFRHTTHIIARWRHNIHEIAVKNCEKSKIRWKILFVLFAWSLMVLSAQISYIAP